jgi:diacylglycerol kinase (ATP)
MAEGRAGSAKRKRAETETASLARNEGIGRIWRAFFNSMRGLREGLFTEAAIRQEIAIAALGLVLSFFVAQDVWTWVALVASMLLVLSVEFLNTAIERLCDHVHPDKHEAIRITKDLASAGVFFALVLCGLVWLAALWLRFAA